MSRWTRSLGAAFLFILGAGLGGACARAQTQARTPVEDAPREVQVPATLRERGSVPELSGALWSPALRRFLLVSDDTGDKAQGTNHAPWLFTMDAAGALDPEPLPILGIDKLNDAEALSPGPDGTLFLTTSHSRDRKGRVKPERRRLYHLALEGRALRVIGALDLAAGAAAIIPGDLDIEGLAYRDGALYVGLKAPLSERGEAQILRVRDPLPALRAGVLPPAQVERFTTVSLTVPGPGGAPVAEGISDLCALPDGSLALLANSPKGAPTDGGGALYHLPPGGPARLVRRFPGLKPEGVTLDEQGRGLVLFFDTDRRTPLWLRQPIPVAPRSRTAPPRPTPGETLRGDR